MLFVRNATFVSLVLLSVATVTNAAKKGGGLKNLPSSIYINTRRFLNFGSTFSSQKKLSSCSYERVASHPVFQVTTAYGAPYMNPEVIDDMDEVTERSNLMEGADGSRGSSKKLAGRQEQQRLCAVFFMDPDDALEMHKQMKQMSNMGNADLRITTTTLAKALRQSCNLGNGLPTGSPVDPLTGKLKGPSEGGSLRYKIVPPKRQLFYATRCFGKERVGFGFGTKKDQDNDAEACLEGMASIRGANIGKKTDKESREQGFASSAAKMTKSEMLAKSTKLNAMQQANAHMEGYTGIPVFHTTELVREQPKLKQLLSGNKKEMPFFFSYEDLEDAWKTLRKKEYKRGNKSMPKKPVAVEVYNLWDVLTSMEKDEWAKKQRKEKSKVSWKKDPVGNIVSMVKPSKKDAAPGLDSITFVPASNAVHYKESITSRGNGKPRLRPMRDWGPRTA